MLSITYRGYQSEIEQILGRPRSHAKGTGSSAAGSASETSESRLVDICDIRRAWKIYIYLLMVESDDLVYDVPAPCRHLSSPCQHDVELTDMANDDNDAGAPLMSDRQTSKVMTATEASVSLNSFVWAMACTSAISGVLFGYDTGVISSTLVSIGSDLSSRPLNTLDKSLITSSTSFFALISSPIAGVLADHLGRKRVILLADILFIFGAMVQALARNVSGMVCVYYSCYLSHSKPSSVLSFNERILLFSALPEI